MNMTTEQYAEAVECVKRSLGLKRSEQLLEALARDARFVALATSEVGEVIVKPLYKAIRRAHRQIIESDHKPGSHEDLLLRLKARAAQELLEEMGAVYQNYEKNLGEFEKHVAKGAR